MNVYDYVTRNAHGKYPAGSHCKVWFDKTIAYLKFDDDQTIALARIDWHFPGIENNMTLQDALFDSISEEISQEIDKEIISELYNIIKEI